MRHSLKTRVLTAPALMLGAGILLNAPSASAQVYALSVDGTVTEVSGKNVPQRVPPAPTARYTTPPMGQTWSMTAGSPPPPLRYSFVPDGTAIPDLNGCGIPGGAGTSNLYETLGARFPSDPLDPNMGWIRLFEIVLNNSERGMDMPLPDSDPTTDPFPSSRGWNAVSGAKVSRIEADPPAAPAPNPFPGSEQDSPTVAIGTGDFSSALSIGHFRIAMRPVPSEPQTLVWVIPPGAGACLGGTAIEGDIIINSLPFLPLAQGGLSDPDAIINLQRLAVFAFGRALGLELTCVSSFTGGALGAAMEPAQRASSAQLGPDTRRPQMDDRRALQRLYGDFFEPNDTRVAATGLSDLLGSSGDDGVTARQFNFLSLDTNTDVDYYEVFIPQTDLQQEIGIVIRQEIANGVEDETGFGYQFAALPMSGICPATGAVIDTRLIQNVQISIEDQDGNPVPVSYPCMADPMVPDIGPVNCGSPSTDPMMFGGFEETLTFVVPANNASYFIRVSSTTGVNDVQPYLMQVTVSASTDAMAEPVEPVLRGLGISEFWDRGIFGFPANYFNLEGAWPTQNHTVFNSAGRSAQIYFEWNGVNPNVPRTSFAARQRSAHPTQVAGLATGGAFGTFRGVADQAQVVAGSVAASYGFGNGFIPSLEAVYFNLFGSADPAIFVPLGMTTRATVINSSFGSLSDSIGESKTAIAYDSAAFMLDQTLVCASGNSGDLDNTAACMRPGGDIPGGQFIGSRTVSLPGTAWNVITVGAVGTDVINQDDDGGPPPPEPPVFEAPNLAVATFSSRGPIDSFNYEDGTVTTNSRAGIHLVAPGVGVLNRPQLLGVTRDCPFPPYGVISRLNLPSFDVADPANDVFFEPSQGTSFAAPIVSGTICLLAEGAIRNIPELSRDPLVFKSVLINSAVKQPGWTNNGNPAMPQDLRDGRPNNEIIIRAQTTQQPLDFAQGGGALNIGRAYEQYLLNPLVVDEITGEVLDGSIDFPSGATKDVAVTNPLRNAVRIIPPPFDDPFPGLGATRPPVEIPGGGGLDLTDLADLPPAAMEVAAKIMTARAIAGPDDYMYTHPDFDDGNPRRISNPSAPFTPSQPRAPIVDPGDFSPPDNEDPITPFTPVQRIDGAIPVERIGWDHARIGQRRLNNPPAGLVAGQIGHIDYVIGPVFRGEIFTATLTWNRDTVVELPDLTNLANPGIDRLQYLELEDLDLQIFQTDPNGDTPFTQAAEAASNARFSNVEHIVRTINLSDCEFGTFILLRVRWDSQIYDPFSRGRDADVEYAVSWRVEPNPDPEANPCLDFGLQTLAGIIQGYNSRVGQPIYKRRFDLTSDAKIDIADLGYLVANWRD